MLAQTGENSSPASTIITGHRIFEIKKATRERGLGWLCDGSLCYC
jgi:hypothetical protein